MAEQPQPVMSKGIVKQVLFSFEFLDFYRQYRQTCVQRVIRFRF